MATTRSDGSAGKSRTTPTGETRSSSDRFDSNASRGRRTESSRATTAENASGRGRARRARTTTGLEMIRRRRRFPRPVRHRRRRREVSSARVTGASNRRLPDFSETVSLTKLSRARYRRPAPVNRFGLSWLSRRKCPMELGPPKIETLIETS